MICEGAAASCEPCSSHVHLLADPMQCKVDVVCVTTIALDSAAVSEKQL